jgi:hypothetical protein
MAKIAKHEEQIRVQARDGEEVTLSRDAARLMGTLKDLMDLAASEDGTYPFSDEDFDDRRDVKARGEWGSRPLPTTRSRSSTRSLLRHFECRRHCAAASLAVVSAATLSPLSAASAAASSRS